MADLAKKKKMRGGHRGHLTKVSAQAIEMISEYDDERRDDAMQLRDTMNEAIEYIRKLDLEILDLIADDEDSSEGDVSQELEETAKIRADAKKIIKRLDEKLDSINSLGAKSEGVEEVNVGPTTSNAPSEVSSRINVVATNNGKVRAKLPKLEVKRFNGNVCHWQEFWDSFESSIHLNDGLSNVDKFNYLRGLVDEPAKSCIAGFSLTSGNYLSAVDILKERYGKKSAVQRAHMTRLMRVERVKDENDVASLRKLCDTVETHYRGLEALGVDKESYSSIVVPSILDKLPEYVRLCVTRGKKYHEWNLEDLLKPLKDEIELREEHHTREPERKNGREKSDKPRWNRGPSSAQALLTKYGEETCAFCLGKHRHEDCKTVIALESRKQILKKYSRCYKCLKKGHVAKNCSVNVKCSACKREHHTALCDVGNNPQGLDEVGEVGKLSSTTLVVSPNNNIVMSERVVALQTAQGMLVGRKSARVRVLFDSGSQRSFVTARRARQLGCKVLRKETLSVGTFGQRASNSEVREVVQLVLKSLRGNEAVQVEAYVVPEISYIKNQHLERVRDRYAHLKGLWLSDVCKADVELEIDVLIGADYLWSFQSDRIVRGKPNEPVAIETVLGWVLSGPVGLKSLGENEEAVVSFVSCASSLNLSSFWDLESIGIKPNEDVHDSVISNLKFNGQRYSVGLPWKENHDPLPSNYEACCKRMKGQIKRLSKEPELLSEYDAIIKNQEQVGIIERVSNDQLSSKVHYIPHQACGSQR